MQIFVSTQLHCLIFKLSVFFCILLLQISFTFLHLVLNALDVQLKLLFNLYMITNLGLILLQHLLVIIRRFTLTANHTFDICIRSSKLLASFVCVLIPVFSLFFIFCGTTLLLAFCPFAFELILMFLHFHVHQNLYTRLYVLEDRVWVRISQPFPLLLQNVFIIRINLHQRWQKFKLIAD